MNSFGHDPGLAHREDVAVERFAEEPDPASYRDLTKEEVLERIAGGYKSAKAGNRRPLQHLLDELDEMDA